jgi:hypothetical protein
MSLSELLYYVATIYLVGAVMVYLLYLRHYREGESPEARISRIAAPIFWPLLTPQLVRQRLRMGQC